MTVHRAEAPARSTAGPSAVYALLVTGATWPTWIFVDSAEPEREGRDGGESVGTIRVYRFRRAGLGGRSREQVLQLVSPRWSSRGSRAVPACSKAATCPGPHQAVGRPVAPVAVL